jgi:hypothetical protein
VGSPRLREGSKGHDALLETRRREQEETGGECNARSRSLLFGSQKQTEAPTSRLRRGTLAPYEPSIWSKTERVKRWLPAVECYASSLSLSRFWGVSLRDFAIGRRFLRSGHVHPAMAGMRSDQPWIEQQRRSSPGL